MSHSCILPLHQIVLLTCTCCVMCPVPVSNKIWGKCLLYLLVQWEGFVVLVWLHASLQAVPSVWRPYCSTSPWSRDSTQSGKRQNQIKNWRWVCSSSNKTLRQMSLLSCLKLYGQCVLQGSEDMTYWHNWWDQLNGVQKQLILLLSSADDLWSSFSEGQRTTAGTPCWTQYTLWLGWMLF